ncbi:hypothetical protein ASPWEDRAFT_29570 [Aspergillus wentii DTO 134E9]|uniref:Uncharacterized protein n=1 Tax=Aspergillus wentii DTO 134E9 TaxID=1073089 RepID=A0A1L9RHK3_ASPWE|nr:uncharacterized protein ASPWEDRAFT_29570 [Aspergillus wentii DTO 134E9]OJJ34420.1 hypothetical protein ASPWEDRAFT_29570 [Aspergillus wentii DTO 134E9]
MASTLQSLLHLSGRYICGHPFGYCICCPPTEDGGNLTLAHITRRKAQSSLSHTKQKPMKDKANKWHVVWVQSQIHAGELLRSWQGSIPKPDAIDGLNHPNGPGHDTEYLSGQKMLQDQRLLEIYKPAAAAVVIACRRGHLLEFEFSSSIDAYYAMVPELCPSVGHER